MELCPNIQEKVKCNVLETCSTLLQGLEGAAGDPSADLSFGVNEFRVEHLYHQVPYAGVRMSPLAQSTKALADVAQLCSTVLTTDKESEGSQHG